MLKKFFIKKRAGIISITAIVFIAVFLMVLGGLSGVSLYQRKVQVAKEQGAQALQIAEAGLDYYKWFLAHNPNDMQDGTGVPGPYVHDYVDMEASTVGKFSLNIAGNLQCGEVARADIVSTGWTNENPAIKKTVRGSYARPSVAGYSYIVNSDVRVASSRTVGGPYHSNGGIVFNGTNLSSVTSEKTTWNCTSQYCSPESSSANGVLSSGGVSSPNPALWKWPVPQIDFNIISSDLTKIYNQNTASRTPSACVSGQPLGCYFPRTTGGAKGYQIVLKNDPVIDATFDMYRVNQTETIRGCSPPWNCYSSVPGCGNNGGWRTEYTTITSGSTGSCPYTPTAAARTFLGTFTLPTACKLVYVDDFVWLEGNPDGKLTIIAASSTSSFDPDIYLRNNITYAPGGPADGLTALAENDILIPLDSPDNFTINGIFIAQKGAFKRNYYKDTGTCTGNDVPAKYSGCTWQNQLNVLGTIVSNGRTGTAWSTSTGPSSGYATRIEDYDSSLTTDPPPLTPYTSDQYQFISWSQD